MKKILVDTSVIVDFLRIKNKAESLFAGMVAKRYLLYISIITHAELFSGKSVWQDKRARKELEELLVGLQLISLEQEISEHAGGLRAEYGIGLLDAIIAATARQNDLPLATFNKKHFQKIKGLKIYEAAT